MLPPVSANGPTSKEFTLQALAWFDNGELTVAGREHFGTLVQSANARHGQSVENLRTRRRDTWAIAGFGFAVAALVVALTRGMEGTGVVLFGAALLAVWAGFRLWRCTSDLESANEIHETEVAGIDRQILWAQYWASLTDGQRASARISKITSIAAVGAVAAVGAGLKLLRILI